jgi:acylphosphatase
MNKTIAIVVTGKVQGVWFRKYTLDKAIELQLNGFVKNLPDDSVSIVATGNKDQLQQFAQWCWQGSPKSKVETVQVSEMELQVFDEFKMER